MFIFVTFLSGLIFGLGLAFSEMTNPAVVLAFLDIFGDWNPSLILVMTSAIIIAMIGYSVQKQQLKPFLVSKWPALTIRNIDSKLIIGASLFGIGWGLSGYCPGPALTALINNPSEGIYFVAAMIVGIGLHFIQSKNTIK